MQFHKSIVLENGEQVKYCVTFRKNSVRLILRRDPSGIYKVSSPRGVSRRKIEQFVAESAGKLKAPPSFVFEDGARLLFEGEDVVIRKAERTEVRDGVFFVQSGKPVEQEVYRYMAGRLSERLKPLLDKWSAFLGVDYTRITIRNNHKVLGSCSRRGSLNFSVILAGFDDALLEYIVIHELTHRKHFNHSRDFYQVLDSCMADRKEREARLRKTSRRCDIFY